MHDKGIDGVASIHNEIMVVAPPERQYPVWIEGLSCLPSTFQHVSTSKGGFNESGPFVVLKKRFCALFFSSVHGER